LINLATTDPVGRVRTIQAFRDELLRGLSLGADYIVVHPGSARDGEEPSKVTHIVAEAIRQSARGLKMGNMRILLENTAGMGKAIGSKFEELAAIIKGAGEVDLGVCIDTAHLFEAGYPIHTPEGLEQTLARLELSVGLDRVFVIHVNDSKTPFGSRVDRHEHIGKGKIGLEAFERILRHPLLSPERVAGRAFLLETPIDLPGDDRRNVAALWKLVGIAADQEPDAEDGFSMVTVARTKKSELKVSKPKLKSARSGSKSKKSLAKNSVKRTAGKNTRSASAKTKKRKRS
jgi:deoxyribonuclease-4